MRNFHFICTSLLALNLMVTSCAPKEEFWEGYDLIPVQQKEDGNWSFIDKVGKVIYEDDFKSQPTVAYNGFFSVWENDGYTLYKAGGSKPTVLGDCENLASVGVFADGLIPVTYKNKRISILDKDGNKKFELSPIKGSEIVSCWPSFTDGTLLILTSESKFGYYDTSGKIVVKPIYDVAGNFIDAVAVVGTKDDNDKYHFKVIDKKGETILSIKEKYEMTQDNTFLFGYLLVKEEDRFVLLNKKGEAKKLSAKIKDVLTYNDRFVIFKNEEDEVGVVNHDGEIIIRPKYKSINFISTDSFLASTEDKSYILNDKGDETAALDYKYVFPCYQSGYLVSDNGKTYTLVDANGKDKSNIDIRNINFQLSPQLFVSTDYFSYSEIAETIADMIDGHTVGKYYKIGEKVSTIFSNDNPANEKYRYKSEIELEQLKREGFNYLITATAYFSKGIVNFEYNHLNNSTDYYWQPASILEGITFEVQVSNHSFGEKGFESLISTFKNRGYKVEKQGWTGGQDDGQRMAVVMTNGSDEILIDCENGDDATEAHIAVTTTAIIPVAEAIEKVESADDLE